MNFEPAPESHPYGEINAGKWFKRVARPLVRYLADVIQISSSISQASVGIALLMLCLFIDATHLTNDGGQKCLPVYLTVEDEAALPMPDDKKVCMGRLPNVISLNGTSGRWSVDV